MGLNRRLQNTIKAGLRGAHQLEANQIKQCLPNFIIIGAAKSATTTLTTILPRHPDFFISKPKEPKFFGRRYDKGWKWYGHLFKRGANHKLRGEGSTMYASSLSSFAQTPALMHRHLPELKLVYIVRDPMERIISHWRHRKGRQRKTPDFELIMRSRHLKKLIVGCSMYHQQLERFREYYPSPQIHCIVFEELISEPFETLRQLLFFLGADSSPEKVNLLLDKGSLPRINEAGDKGRVMIQRPQWTPKLRKQVLNVVRPDAEKLLISINKPLNTWALKD